ncbi:hypothetical protein M0654_11315 [Rhizobium sp. NTR19]|uniref:Transposase n=1 Tax=Neorhizobium turbinariae TaxID=2937795 RepID=A0ABT0IRT6_9HYPH|nr:hypothetical protein [Neorhizobium turbinariae]MCK8780575.1 hypothetical protein [Neorhizobium turbinariae]
MTDLIPDEIETLRMLAGQLPRRMGVVHMICLMQLVAFGFCTPDEPPQITDAGVQQLEEATGTIDFRSRSSS